MKLFIDGEDCGEAVILSIDTEEHFEFGRLEAVGRDTRVLLKAEVRLSVGAGDRRRFELRDERLSIPISPYGATNADGFIEALINGEMRALDAADESLPPPAASD